MDEKTLEPSWFPIFVNAYHSLIRVGSAEIMGSSTDPQVPCPIQYRVSPLLIEMSHFQNQVQCFYFS